MASSNQDLTFLQMLEDNYLECTLCYETYKEPKTLACQHAFCLECLESYLKHNNNILKCPVCREDTPLPKEGASKLRSNFLLKSLTDEANIFKQGKVIKCNNCSEDKIATMVCSDCPSFMCANCYQMHQAVKYTRDSHHSFEIAKLSEAAELHQFQRNRFALCDIHKEPKKLFCKTEKIQLCHTCAFTSAHQKHDIWSLHEEIDSITIQIGEKCEKLQGNINTVEKQNKYLTEILSKVQTTKNESIASIDKEKKALFAELEKRYKNMKKEIRNAADKMENELKQTIAQNKTFCDKLAEKNRTKEGLQVIPMMNRVDAAQAMLIELDELKETKTQQTGSTIQVKEFVANGDVEKCLSPGKVNDISFDVSGCQETMSIEDIAKNLKIGDKVKRGQDWRWGIQDGNSEGTVIVIKSDKWVRVKWYDDTENNYRMGVDNKYDLRLV